MQNFRFGWLGALLAATVMVFSMALPAEARMGGSFGSRGMRTFSSPSITEMAPSPVAPIQRSMTPNTGGGYSTPGYGAPNSGFGLGGGFWPGFGGGLLGGMLGGLFFHGLFGSMLGYGFGGIGGGISSLFQLVLVGGLLWFLFRRFGRPSMVSGPTGSPYGGQGYGPQGPFGMGGSGPANPARRDEIGVTNADLARFEQMLGEVQAAFSREDHQGLRQLTTPEMVSYLSEELADNATHGLRNDVTNLHFVRGELSEAWREGARDYATVALQWTATDVMRDRTTGEIKRGDPDHPAEAKEYWTFVRESGGPWLLSAIQDARG